MYRTSLVMLYWDRDTEELVWDMTGQANLERVRAALGRRARRTCWKPTQNF
ncbi:MAG: hypothetical protein ACLU6B_11260 [Lachnospirales bacterium]